MRIRAVVAVVLLVLPASLSAQRIPLPMGRRPGERELPPQPAPIANELAVKRWRLAVESYPMVSYFQSAGVITGHAQAWTSIGTGTRADYLLNRHISATMDVTSSFLGGPLAVTTAELGTRVHPEWAEHRLFPFADFRAAYISMAQRLGTIGSLYVDPIVGNVNGPRYSDGYGAIGGAGFEYSFTRTWSLMTEASVVTSRMKAQDFQYPSRSYGLTGVRYMLGVKYNPVRIIRAPDTR